MFRTLVSFVRVHISPFRMSDEAMIEHQTGKWYSFWKNLQEGYRLLEESRIPLTSMSEASVTYLEASLLLKMGKMGKI